MNAPLVTRQRAHLESIASFEATRGLLLGLGGLAVAVSQSLDPWLVSPLTRQTWDLATIVSGGLISLSGALFSRLPGVARPLAYVGLIGVVLVALPGLLEDPARAFLIGLSAAAVWIRVRWTRAPGESADADVAEHPAVPGAALETSTFVALGAWFVVSATQLSRGPIATGAAAFSFTVALYFTALWFLQSWRRTPPRERWTYAPFVPLLTIALARSPSPDQAFSWLAVNQLVALVLLGVRRQAGSSLWSGIVEHPARLLVTTFAGIAIAGGIVLSLPICAAHGNVTVIDAFFTSVSATCVTGLHVLDTPQDLTFFGQLVILVLIQIGGLGIMTFSAGGVLLLGQRFGMRQETALRDILADSSDGEGDLYVAARNILAATAVIEGIGALVLAGLFRWTGDTWAMAAWRGVFTAIAAFCNAGFALQSDNMISYQREPVVLLVVASLIVLGGLGTPALVALRRLQRRNLLPLQSKLVYVVTLALLVVPTIAIAVLEWDHTFHGLSVVDRISNALFTAITPRTAGLSSIDYTAVHPATATITMLLMFIGGSPFSTAGGVKTTTIALVALAVIATIRGRSEVTAFGRTVSSESIYKAMAIMTMGSLSAFLGVVAIQLTQDNISFEAGLFEVVSALGTVGLSIGATEELDTIGKIIIMVCMFSGRVGPITLFLLLTERRREPKWVLPEEKVAVG